ncbi:hypothetical protein NE237_023906 [Protea cynaroides]|uniref:Phytocyanin domain-containing protein n=1 Tax=Protea cynaroides TaxID=273540 RepID=A0A9Q0HCN0_9MAGN|nr:hypothetical protein NE237_023906 [Protea cynaroides]
MGFRSEIGYTQIIFLLILGTVSVLGVGNMAKTIVVGGSEGWRFGFNYTVWAFNNGPYYLNDTLVFKYDPPNSTTHPHNVYLLRDFWSYRRCDMRRAKMIGNVTDGVGEGLKVVLKRWQPYYFACTERDGYHCNQGQMKFPIFPMPRCRNTTHG